jgi:flavin-dependent dehydrogenase
MSESEITCDVCVIGAGPGGLTAASTLAMRGRKVVVANSGSLMGYG